MPQMSPLFWMNLYIMFLLSLILVLVVQYFLVIYCKLDLMEKKDQEINKVWKW
uniref:ATP synthase F0 subunit 8 n=1 Tax=Procambarus fallax TaxID=215716 RepID=L0E8T8_9EUCA|nr:ATP synthase F0 subunit 8 [Procambarus fallax]AGA56105.1 ATP synthase F0 subunit 8 [Procambarus fallax]ALM30845.1 ATP synthase F0 subunit 8 [Procambarus fallax]